MITIFGTYRSRATRNFWLLAEMGVAYKYVSVVQAYRLADPSNTLPLNTLSPEFLAISPAGAIPALRDGDFVLSDSQAINQYLCQTHSGPLGPQNTKEEALVAQWAFYGATTLEQFTLPILYVYAENQANTPEGITKIAQLTDALRRPLTVVNAHLQNTGYMVGTRFTVADINMAEVMRYAQDHPDIFANFPAIAAWIAACQARPAFTQMMAAREKEPVQF